MGHRKLSSCPRVLRFIWHLRRRQHSKKQAPRPALSRCQAGELFAAQDAAYQESVLPTQVTRRVAIEAGSSLGWHRWVGTQGQIIAVDKFGASAPASTIFKEYGFSVENVVAKVKETA